LQEVVLVKHRIADLLRQAIQSAHDAGEVPASEIPAVTVGRPKDEAHGDYDCSVALKMARVAGMPPLRVAQAIAARIPTGGFLDRVEVAAPGFLNFTLCDAWLAQQVNSVIAQGESYGNSQVGQGQRVQVEFVSANPTGPLHIGTARNAVLGDALASLLAAAGYSVEREYLINDGGSQMAHFNSSLFARYAQALGQDVRLPEDGYQGEYLVDMGKALVQAHGDRFWQMAREEGTAMVGELGRQQVLGEIRTDLARLGIRFDCWYSESEMYARGDFDRLVAYLRGKDLLADYDGAVWLKGEPLGLDKDEVVVRSTGRPGYLATDLAYHYDKFIRRGFDWVINVWAADHQNQARRLPPMMAAYAVQPSRLTILLYQNVTLRRGGELVRLSKRTGDIITLREVVDEVGADAVRFFLLARAPMAQMDFDLQVAKEQSDENPVYYVQYGHARIASILRHAAEAGFSGDVGDCSLLVHPAELALIRKMIQLPEMVETAVLELAPHVLPHYAQDLAGLFHSFYKQCRVISSLPEDRPLSEARLRLVRAAQIVLARALHLMGVSAPEQM
jgi:arginyl-tRNA synthetase